jgi:hypothetical protein
LVAPGYLAAVWQWDFHRYGDDHRQPRRAARAAIFLALALPGTRSALLGQRVPVGPDRALRAHQTVAERWSISLCCLTSFFLVAGVSATKLSWYVAPALPLIVVLAALATRRWFFLVLPFAVAMVGMNVVRESSLADHAARWNADQMPIRTPKAGGGTETYYGPVEFYRERQRISHDDR